MPQWNTRQAAAGRAAQSNFDDYPVVRMAESPKNVEIAFVASDHGIFGLGEDLTAQIVPAIGNAIFAATGTRVRTLPVRKVGTGTPVA